MSTLSEAARHGTRATNIAVIHGQSGAEGLSLTISARTVLVAALSAVTIELVFGTYPARRAARLSPMEAIRHE
ncbi:MAG TPA: hypothetical protein VIJ90_07020 [Gemmatimonadaceae bacterium]